MRFFLLMFFSLFLWGSDAAFKAYVTSVEFEVVGPLYAYDFDRDGKLEHDEYLLLVHNRLYHIDLAKGFSAGSVPIDFSVEKASFVGYIVQEPQKGLYLLLRGDGGVSLFQKGRFKPLESELGYEIENGHAAVVYNDLTRFTHILASYDTPGFAWSLSQEEDELLVADGKEGVVALNEERFEPLWSFKDGGSLFCVLSLGGGRYALGTSEGLHILQKSSCKILKSLFPGRYVSKFLDDGRSFLALVEHEGLYRIDKSDFEVQKMDASLIDPQDIVFDGDSIIVVDGNEGLVVLSRRTKKLLDRTDLKAVAATDRYIATLPWQSKTLLLYDRKTKKVGKYHGATKISNIKALHGTLYLLYDEAYIDRIKIESNGSVTLQKRIFLPYPAMDLIEVENTICVAIGGGGVLKIVK